MAYRAFQRTLKLAEKLTTMHHEMAALRNGDLAIGGPFPDELANMGYDLERLLSDANALMAKILGESAPAEKSPPCYSQFADLPDGVNFYTRDGRLYRKTDQRSFFDPTCGIAINAESGLETRFPDDYLCYADAPNN